MKTKKLEAVGYKIELQSQLSGDFISLTDIAKYKTKENPGYVIQNWMRNRNTVRFLGLWESLHNTQFNYLEFEAIEKESGLKCGIDFKVGYSPSLIFHMALSHNIIFV